MNVLLADPDKTFVNQVLEDWKLQDAILTAITDVSDVLSVLREDDFSVVFLSSDFLVLKDLDAVSFIKEHQPGVEIIILCSSKSVQQSENAVSRGASHYFLKPVDAALLENSARKTRTRMDSRRNYRLMEDHVLEDLLGNTPEMRKILRLLYKVAPTTSTILITGESGTGKEFVANIIHRLSKRSEEPFVTINCGAIPENIVESELFGARKGAFTGAVANKTGLFEEADSGTLFLDEVAELHSQTQVKLLRFLQEREIRPVGGTVTRQIDVRVIAATNRNVHEAVKEGIFREDLFYRLNTFQIHLPPLRNRKSSIPELVKFFILKYQQEHDKNIIGISKAAQLALGSYDYPGNIRELEHIIEHAVVLAENAEIRLEDLPENLYEFGRQEIAGALPNPVYNMLPEDNSATDSQDDFEIAMDAEEVDENATTLEPGQIITLAEMERRHILTALTATNNNQSEAARKLGISRSTLWRKLQEHKIQI